MLHRLIYQIQIPCGTATALGMLLRVKENMWVPRPKVRKRCLR